MRLHAQATTTFGRGTARRWDSFDHTIVDSWIKIIWTNRPMEPIFTLPYSEFCVAQQLARLLPATKGYSLYAPVSRQQPGVDLLIARRRNQRIGVASIQVKSSRTYLKPTPTARTKKPFRYGTRFNNFRCPPEADFFCLVWFYPAVNKAQRRELGTWWAPQILLFSQTEMRRFLRSVRTVGGKKRDSYFYFEFNQAGEAVLTRGDSKRRSPDFSKHLLSQRLAKLRRFLSS
jgi:hypothetical protein